jgi:hypothetical protein
MENLPKIIHCCWLSGYPLSDQANHCLDTWKKFLPDYEIKLWTNKNYDLSKNLFLREMVKRQLWANASDYVRKDVVYQYGGIYLDLDVEMIKDPRSLYDRGAFVGFERWDDHGVTRYSINDGPGFGAAKGSPLLQEILDAYSRLEISDLFQDNKSIYMGPDLETKFLEKKGLKLDNLEQKIMDFTILPWDYLTPMDMKGNLTLTDNSISIHLYRNSVKNPNSNWITFQFEKYRKKHPGASPKRIRLHLWLTHPINMFKNRFLRGKKNIESPK